MHHIHTPTLPHTTNATHKCSCTIYIPYTPSISHIYNTYCTHITPPYTHTPLPLSMRNTLADQANNQRRYCLSESLAHSHAPSAHLQVSLCKTSPLAWVACLLVPYLFDYIHGSKPLGSLMRECLLASLSFPGILSAQALGSLAALANGLIVRESWEPMSRLWALVPLQGFCHTLVNC